MNKASLILTFCAILAMPAALRAADAPPSVKTIPDEAAWVMTSASAGPSRTAADSAPGRGDQGAENQAPARDPGAVQSVRVERAGGVQQVVVTPETGAAQTIWLADGEIFSDVNDVISSAPANIFTPALFSAGRYFFGTEWIKPDHFAETTDRDGRSVAIFRAKTVLESNRAAAAMAGVPEEQLAVDVEAWLDRTSGLPVRVIMPEGTFTYEFTTPPRAPLVLPTAFREKQHHRQQEVEQQQRDAAVR